MHSAARIERTINPIHIAESAPTAAGVKTGRSTFNAQPQFGPLGWITDAIMSAFKTLLNTLVGGLGTLLVSLRSPY